MLTSDEADATRANISHQEVLQVVISALTRVRQVLTSVIPTGGDIRVHKGVAGADISHQEVLQVVISALTKEQQVPTSAIRCYSW